VQRKQKLDRGKILASVIERYGVNKTVLAAKAGYSRSSYYKHIENPNLSYHIISKYGIALNHDFTKEFIDMPKYEVNETKENYDLPADLNEALYQISYWKNKYIDLLEKYNSLIEENLNRRGN